MPRDDTTSAAISNDASGEFIRLYRTQKRKCDEENGVLRGIVKRAKEQGVNTKSMIAAVAATKLDPDVVTSDLRDQLRYMSLMRIALSPDELFSWNNDEISPSTLHDDDLWDAEDAGYRAGRAGQAIEDAPYEPGTDLHAHFIEQWHKGQAAIARELGQDVVQATDEAPRRGRKAAQPRLAQAPRRGRKARDAVEAA